VAFEVEEMASMRRGEVRYIEQRRPVIDRAAQAVDKESRRSALLANLFDVQSFAVDLLQALSGAELGGRKLGYARWCRILSVGGGDTVGESAETCNRDDHFIARFQIAGRLLTKSNSGGLSEVSVLRC